VRNGHKRPHPDVITFQEVERCGLLRFARVEHLDDNAASEFVSGTLPPSALGKVEGHLASCRECRALVAALAVDAGEDSSAKTFRHERLSASPGAELPRTALSIGDRVGRYLVLSSIGAGGMGVVFAAYDPQLDRKIALKLLRSGFAGSNKDARARLRREAQAIAQLSHPNVVSIYDVGTTDDGDLYIAMEFVEGDTLTSWLKTYPRSWREIIDVFVQAARGLLSAHRVGLLHRDFKPDNVLVGGDGRVRVTDFGLARSLLAPDEVARAKPVMTALDLALTVTGTVLGTPRYMPPEQLTGPELDARSDQFSFCVALYEALYGVHPLPGGTSVSMLERGDKALPPPEGLKIPVAIDRAVLRGLERDRDKRFPSMSSLIDELMPAPRRSPVRTATLATAAVLLIGGTTAALVAQRPPPAPVAKESPNVPTLSAEIHRLENERDSLLAAIDGLEQRHTGDRETLARIRDELEEKTQQIEALEVQIQQLKTDKVRLVQRARRLPPAPTIADAMASARRPIEGCFAEWAERNEGAPDEVSEATLIIALTVTPDGVGTMPRILSTPDEHPMSSPDGAPAAMSLLEHCVSEQLARVRYPRGLDRLEVEVTFQWSPDGVEMTPHVRDRQQAPRGRVDL
jgi:serine/threonine protein kinase